MTIEVSETGVYPRAWREFIGQDLAKAQLQLAAKSAKKRRRPMPHTLLAHPDGGIGKTALAKLAAREMGTRVFEVSGRMPISTARRLLSDMRNMDVLFWDEFHRSCEGGKKNAEWLLHFLQDGVLLGPFGPEPQPAVTVLAATTDLHALPHTIVGRFMRPPMGTYDLAQAAKIAMLMADKVLVPEGLPKLPRRNALTIASAANCNPRAIRALLCTLRDVAIVHEADALDGPLYRLDRVFEFHGVTTDGLDHAAQEYLRVLLNEFPTGAGARAMADRLMEYDLADVERVLMDKGYIGKTRSGRILTAAGMKRAKELLAA